MVYFIDHIEFDEWSYADDGEWEEEDCEESQQMYKLTRFMIMQSQTVETPIIYPSSSELHKSILTLKEPDDGNTPLHVLCRSNSDTHMMKIIFECCPIEKSTEMALAPTARDLVRITNSHGLTPLHYLVDEFYPFSSLKLMLQYC